MIRQGCCDKICMLHVQSQAGAVWHQQQLIRNSVTGDMQNRIAALARAPASCWRSTNRNKCFAIYIASSNSKHVCLLSTCCAVVQLCLATHSARLLQSAKEDPSQLPDAVAALDCRGNFMFDAATHRDFLGAILGTGVVREKVGVSGSRRLLQQAARCLLPAASSRALA